MAKFLLSIAYPPAQRRPYDNEVTQRAREGFELLRAGFSTTAECLR